LNYNYVDTNRSGDHIWWISDIRKFQSHYPDWSFKYNLPMIIDDLYKGLRNRA
jgi:CDP-paratose 2-epimerase